MGDVPLHLCISLSLSLSALRHPYRYFLSRTDSSGPVVSARVIPVFLLCRTAIGYLMESGCGMQMHVAPTVDTHRPALGKHRAEEAEEAAPQFWQK